MKSLKENLTDWTDWDQAELAIAKSLNILSPDSEMTPDTKGIFWSTNPLGNFLADVLEQMSEIGILEFREKPDLQFRWNNDYTLGSE
ncbi:MAG: hypothetical protein KKE17_10590 [Proteobacteria bacterium]|nr:hypothetical protein [Pseudomonadota bacterium]MBU1710439.1 hypothetical protein [Pseudomonadota bacterium]